jgi:hypothetical protein
MSETMGRLLAAGQRAEVFEWGSRVVKLCRSKGSKIFEISVLLMADTYTPPFCRSAPPNRWGERDFV